MNLINGWTKTQMIKRITELVPDTIKGNINDKGDCIYCSEDGSRCVAGAFMPEEVARLPENKGVAASSTLKKVEGKLKYFEGFPLKHEDMDILQAVHDRNMHMQKGTDKYGKFNDRDYLTSMTARERCIKFIEEYVQDN